MYLGHKRVEEDKHKVYNEYLVKWHNLSNEDATWMSEDDIKQHGTSIQELISTRA